LLNAEHFISYASTLNPKAKQLAIETRELAPGTAIVSLAGRLMLGPEGQEVETVVCDLLDKGYRKIIFEMSGLTHIDSTGIGRCISSLNKISQAGGKLSMAGAGGQVRDGFRVTRLDRIFRFFDDLEGARAALG
jgi:anti-anti-sigma factor